MIKAQIMELDTYKGELKEYETFQDVVNELYEISVEKEKSHMVILLNGNRMIYYAISNMKGEILYIND